MKKILVLLLSVVMLFSLALVGCGGEEQPEEPTIEYFNYTELEDGSYSVGLTVEGKQLTEVEVPATYKKKPVVAISASGFKNAKQLESVTLPASIEKIGLSGFENCTKLTTIDITNVKTLSRKSFYKCTKLSGITINENVETIPQDCFFQCSSLTEIVIPNSVKTIGNNAFQECARLSKVTLGSGLEEIGNYAFSNCTSWTDLKLPTEKTLTLGSYAFLYCGFTTVKIPANVQFGKIDLSEYTFQYLAWDEAEGVSNCTAIYFYDTTPDKNTIGKNSVGFTWDRADFKVYVPEGLYNDYDTLCTRIMNEDGDNAWVRCVTSLGKLATFDPTTNPYDAE